MRRGFAAAVAMIVAGSAVGPRLARGEATREATRAEESLQATAGPAGQSSPQKPTEGQPASQGQSGQATPAAAHSLHFVTVKFDYDFGKTPACSAKVKTACVEEFVAYDISAGVKNRSKLFEIGLPAKPIGFVPGITGKSPKKLDFESGKHWISVVAREPDGTESRHKACTTWIVIQ